MSASIAFVLLSHREPAQLLRLVTTLNRLYDDPPIACHHDFSQCPLDTANFPGNVRFVTASIRTGWAKWSVVRAMLAALRLLYDHADPDWFILLSGADYPIRDAAAVRAEGVDIDLFTIDGKTDGDARSLAALIENADPDGASWGGFDENAPCGLCFTSGSTGEPKGTVLEHRAFSSSSLAHTGPLRLTPDVRALQFAAHTFDASLVDILSVLMNGGTVCIPSEESRINDLAGAINGLRVTYIGLTPSVVEFLTPAMIPNVDTVCLAGEAMAVHQRDMWCELNLVNGFGPTETSITSAGNPNVTRETDVKDIGLPVGGLCWIVDPHDHHRLMPVGMFRDLIISLFHSATNYIDRRCRRDVG